ncbi:MAG: methyltransferase domain-containing protein, partial [Acidobacteriia bacterium]|nr:methyltransferase domain-containing protein [Terriglobia bacterium]
YIPSASDTMHRHFGQFAAGIRERFLGEGKSLLVDIGCNDGLFLSAAHQMGIRTLGIDPAANIAELARQKGLSVVTRYFSPETAAYVLAEHGPAKVIVTTNTLNHVDDLHGFMKGIDTLLAPDGVFVVEAPQALSFVQKNEFDTIYHEHLSVFSVKSLAELYRFFGMSIFDIEELDVHGGSMRVYARREGGGMSAVVEQWLARENAAKLFDAHTYEVAARAARSIREELLSLLDALKRGGKRVAGYGAPAKGNTLLNYCRIGPDRLDYLVDRNPLKHGLYSPGMRIPIAGPEKLAADPPDYLLVLAWNFAEEIMRQQSAFAERGGKFILPIPKPEVIG